MTDYKKDLGAEVIKEDVTTPYLRQEAEFTACFSKGELDLQGTVSQQGRKRTVQDEPPAEPVGVR